MRKVVFYINDREYFKNEFKRQKPDITAEGLEKILEDIKPLELIFTVYGNGKSPDRFELTDKDGNKVCMSSLNGYEKGVVINECYAYFEGRNDTPCGVVGIEESDV